MHSFKLAAISSATVLVFVLTASEAIATPQALAMLERQGSTPTATTASWAQHSVRELFSFRSVSREPILPNKSTRCPPFACTLRSTANLHAELPTKHRKNHESDGHVDSPDSNRLLALATTASTSSPASSGSLLTYQRAWARSLDLSVLCHRKRRASRALLPAAGCRLRLDSLHAARTHPPMA